MLGLSRASYYRGEPLALDPADTLRLMRLIDEEYTPHPFYASRKMTSWLRRQGYAVNRQQIRRLMRRLGLQSVAPKPCTSRPAPAHPVYPYLLRGLAIVRPNRVWCTDITYIRLAHGFVYLTAVMDGYSRYVLSLGGLGNHDRRILYQRPAERLARSRPAGDLQQRSGCPVHPLGLYCGA